MASSQPALDEIVYQHPNIIAWYLATFPGATAMDENMIHRYIAESPFFDHMTNNGLAIAQSGNNLQLFNMTWNRAAFEDDLKRKRGVEYMITGAPQAVKEGEEGWAGSGKTGERSTTRGLNGRVEEDLTTLGTYYLVGENMYQAPSIADIVSNRVLSATNHLAAFLSTASELPSFDPATGYTYLPHATTTKPNTAGFTSGSTPARSRSTSLVPGAADSQSLRSGSLAPDAAQASLTGSDRAATRLLAQSLQLSLEFGSEYSDENPLHGTPGNFSFTHTAAAVKKRRADDAAAEAAAMAAKERAQLEREGKVAGGNVFGGSVFGGNVVAEPPAVMTQAKAGPGKDVGRVKDGAERRASRMDGGKVKRKKSRGVNAVGTPGPGAA
ncbi:Mediator of RNA polymerase II transcription subunit 6 [Extremus antarcticus]|uniref:Mediator of RNA polymerase II transcription subunit 6 n=1 Tax=Extremus antarcticus TaxID=702011 RepID=A0AAJ0LUQ0_9PEZI|nr:Mediator of RNA polymerase II transcription subunit 6 [Extremus antarcticus]